MMDWENLQKGTQWGKWLEYQGKKEAFAKSHKPCKCENCGTDIEPGADVIVDAVHVFCNYECCAAFNNAERLIFNDDDEYKSIFEKREDGK